MSLPRLSQNVYPQRQHTAQPDGVVDVIGVGVAGGSKMLRPSRLSISHGKNEANNGGGKAI
jgi:hypothetical protein